MRLTEEMRKSGAWLAALLFFGGAAAGFSAAATNAPPSQTQLTVNCDSCQFAIAPGQAPYSIRFKTVERPNGRRVVLTLLVSRQDKREWTQSLPVHDMSPVRKNDKVFIGSGDINFDGCNDLFFATSRGVANTFADYWVFVPSKEEFKYVGNYPLFRIDTANHSLSSYERGGHGGMIYEANQYRFTNDVLTLIGTEKQEATAQEGVYRKSVLKLQDGKLRVVEVKKVTAPLK